MTSDPRSSPQTTFRETLAWLSALFERVRKWWEENSEAIEPFIRLAHRHVVFNKAGWLLHYTTPFDLIGDDITAAGLSDLLDDYYRRNWPQVSAEFRARLAALDVDGEAKATFCEALDAHGAGFYRATVRLLFPEIERVARIELLEGSLKGIASLKEVRKAAGEQLGLSDLEPMGGGPVIAQFARMSGHLYEEAKTPELVAKLAGDPVPNRHAAVHGLVEYRTLQSSLNALIMTEFMFQVVTALKAVRGLPPSGSLLPRNP